MTVIQRATSIWRRLNGAVDRWLTAPEDHAAGRLGLFRILFSLFYLWRLSGLSLVGIGRAPAVAWEPIYLTRLLPAIPSVAFFQAGEFVLVFCLCLLMIGWRVRLMTVVVLLVGVALEGLRFSLGKIDHDSLFLVFYIPLFMSLSRWGDTYSLDAALRGEKVDPSASSWRFSWPIRATLLMLAFLFVTAVFWKITNGTWASNPMTMANLLTGTDLSAAAEGRATSALRLLPTQVPLLSAVMQAGTLAFEGLFFLSLFNRRLRNGFIALACIFHALNLLLLGVTFAPQIAAYALFVDWQRLYERWLKVPLRRVHWRKQPNLQISLAVAVALIAGLLWTFTRIPRPIMQIGGLLTPATLWYWALPFAAAALARTGLSLTRDFRARVSSRTKAPA